MSRDEMSGAQAGTSRAPADVETKREELFYMAIALLSAKRSKDPIRKVGACIVNEKEGRIVGIGYNGMPLNCRDDVMPWKDKNKNDKKLKHYYVADAELNALINMSPQSVDGCTIFVTLHPCKECAKIIVRSGISRVVYLSFDECYRNKKSEEYATSESVLKANGVKCDIFTWNYVDDKKLRQLIFKKHPKSPEWFQECMENFGLDYNDLQYRQGDKTVPKQAEKREQRLRTVQETIPKLVQGLENFCENDEEIEEIDDMKKEGERLVERWKNATKKEKNWVELLQNTFLKHISWEQYFMGLAITARDFMCVDNSYKGGACIVNEDNRVVGLGFHDRLLTETGTEDTSAEINAIVSKHPVSLRDCTMYVTHFPCHNSAQAIIQSGIKAIVYLGSKSDDPEALDATERMFELAKVRRVEYSRCYETKSVILDFTESNIK